MKTLFRSILFGSSVTLSCSLGAAAEPLVQKGLELSRTHCARCHVIEDKNPFGGISSTPSFKLLVNALTDWEERFSSFHTRLPHPSIIRFKGEEIDPDKPELYAPFVLDYEDVEAFVAYAKSLKKDN